MRLRLLCVLAILALPGCKPEQPQPTTQAEAAGHADGQHEEEEAGVVVLDEAAQASVGLAVAAAGPRRLATDLVTTGELATNANREAHVTTRVAGRVSMVGKNVGDRVTRGDVLARLESVELGQSQAVYLQALERWELAGQTADRQRKLFGEDLIAKKDLLAAENAHRLARIDRDSARNQLALYGFDAARIATLSRTHTLDPALPLIAPLSGVVLTRHLTIGELLRPEAEQPAFTISDVSELWVDATIFEKDLAKVRVGQTAIVSTPAYPGVSHTGRVSLVSTSLEKTSRTATARVVVPNPDGRLKPEMTASIRIRVGETRTLAIPTAAVLRDDARTYVFVREAPTRFRLRDVKVGDAVDGWVPVLEGLTAGTPVVGRGSFSLKAELNKDAGGGHGH